MKEVREIPMQSTHDKNLLERLKIKVLYSAYTDLSWYHYWESFNGEPGENPDPDAYREVMWGYYLDGYFHPRYQAEDRDHENTKRPMRVEDIFGDSFSRGSGSTTGAYRFLRDVYAFLLLPVAYLLMIALFEGAFLDWNLTLDSMLPLASVSSLNDVFAAPIGLLLFTLFILISILRIANGIIREMHNLIMYTTRYIGGAPATLTVILLEIAHHLYFKLKIRIASIEYKRRWEEAISSSEPESHPA